MVNIESHNTKTVAILSGFLGTAIGLTVSYFTAVSGIQVLKVQVQTLNDKINSSMDDRYRGEDARRDFALVQQQISQNAHQIEELQKIVREHSRLEHE